MVVQTRRKRRYNEDFKLLTGLFHKLGGISRKLEFFWLP